MHKINIAGLVAVLESHLEALQDPASYHSLFAQRPSEIVTMRVNSPIAPDSSILAELEIRPSHENIARSIKALADDDAVSAIVLDWDCPGGAVLGIDASVEAVRYAKKKKPVISYTNGMMCSAAYWIASQSTEILAAENTALANIGVIMVTNDYSKALENEGVKYNVIRSTPLKGLGTPVEPLSAEGRTELEQQVMETHNNFVADVAAGRGVSLEQAGVWADARVHGGSSALELGLIDGVHPNLESVLERTRQIVNKQLRPRERMQKGASKMTLEQLKAEHPDVFNAAFNEGQASVKPQAAAVSAADTERMKKLEATVLELQSRAEADAKISRDNARRAMAMSKLEAAALPQVDPAKTNGLDLNASFKADLEQAALSAATDEQAAQKVDEMLVSRKAILGVSGVQAQITQTTTKFEGAVIRTNIAAWSGASAEAKTEAAKSPADFL